MRKRAQSTIEYTVIIAAVALALLAMQVYFKRGLQGRFRGSADELSGGVAYAPGATNAVSTFSRTIEENSSSETIKEDSALGDINEKSVSKSSVSIDQRTERNEAVK
ncbi:MAG: hypothetical protein WC321_06305 [Candidatus Omnitrophota bacterium]|jgi:Flp pilus assembly pilin Flp